MHSTSSSRRTAAGRTGIPKPPSPERRSRWIGAILIVATLAIAAALLTSGTVSLGTKTATAPPKHPVSKVPAADVTVDFATTTATDDPAAIGVDESAYGSPSDVNDPTAQRLLKKLGVGYARLALTLANPADSTSSVTCAAEGCDTAINPDKWVQVMDKAGEVPVAGIPDTISGADAAAIVKRFAGSDSAGRPIMDWVIGNEPEAANENATTYDARFNSLYDAMKKADPLIKIGGPATLGFDQAFLQQFLKDCGSRADFTDFHFYPGHEDSAQLLAELPAMSQDLTTLRGMIEATVPARASSIAIHVGEWNFSADPGTLDQYAFTGFASVLDADLLGRVLSAGADTLAWGSKNGPLSLLYGDTFNEGGTGAPSGYKSDSPMPLFQAIGMFTGQGLFPRFGTAIVSATSVMSGIDAFASSSPDEIVIVNTSTSAKRISLRVSDSGRQTARVWQLHQAGSVATPPVRQPAVTSAAGEFKLALPGDSVTTLVVTTVASDQKLPPGYPGPADALSGRPSLTGMARAAELPPPSAPGPSPRSTCSRPGQRRSAAEGPGRTRAELRPADVGPLALAVPVGVTAAGVGDLHPPDTRVGRLDPAPDRQRAVREHQCRRLASGGGRLPGGRRRRDRRLLGRPDPGHDRRAVAEHP